MAAKLTAKLFITGTIVAETGLHVGGSKAALDIGGIDLSVVKTASGVPFIPGSSLKGKLRSILAREHGSEDVSDDPEPIATIFGSANQGDEGGTAARLIVRDAPLDRAAFEAQRGKDFLELEMPYTESKWENTINRKTGTAQHPRQLERVPAGAAFQFEMVYNVFDDGVREGHLTALRKAMRMLEDDYLGGQGSRGYGKVAFQGVRLLEKTIADYEGDNEANVVQEDFLA